MKVLVTGAGGQLGQALVRSVPADITLLTFKHSDLDISDNLAVENHIDRSRPDVIVNSAAFTNVDAAETERERARAVNADGPRNLAMAARSARSRLIHISTDFVFDGTSPLPYGPASEPNPLNVYGNTKRDGEGEVLRVLPEHSVVLRTAWIYATEGRNFVRTVLRRLNERGFVRVVSDQVGTPTSAQSLADTIWKLVGMPNVNGIHHWTDAGVASWYDFAVAIAEEGAALNLIATDVTVMPIATHEYPTAARRPPYSVLDSTSLRSRGIAPRHWRENLRDVLREIAHA